MKIEDIMTSNPACCTPDASLVRVAELMIECDCGEIPVLENVSSGKPVGVVTDRDIVCRTLGKGLNPLDMHVGDIMTTPVLTVTSDSSFEDCCNLMEEKQIRRVPVVDSEGSICGIVALADIAKYSSKLNAGEVVQEVSEQTAAASNVN